MIPELKSKLLDRIKNPEHSESIWETYEACKKIINSFEDEKECKVDRVETVDFITKKLGI